MYLRFTTPGAVTRAGVPPGFFRVAHEVSRHFWPDPVAQALWIELCWFNDHLPVPSGRHPFAVRAQRVWHSDGVCWFRPEPEAREAIARAHVVAALLRDCGCPVERLTARHPGTILYRDAMQVVAKPH